MSGDRMNVGSRFVAYHVHGRFEPYHLRIDGIE